MKALQSTVIMPNQTGLRSPNGEPTRLRQDPTSSGTDTPEKQIPRSGCCGSQADTTDTQRIKLTARTLEGNGRVVTRPFPPGPSTHSQGTPVPATVRPRNLLPSRQAGLSLVARRSSLVARRSSLVARRSSLVARRSSLGSVAVSNSK